MPDPRAVWACPFCDGQYPNFGDDHKTCPNLPVPRITDAQVLRFFMTINRQNWTHVLCCGMGVTTYDDLLGVDADIVYRSDAHPTELFSLIQMRDREFFVRQLVALQKRAAGVDV